MCYLELKTAMGEEDAATGVAEAVENGNTLPEKGGEVLTEKKEDKGGVKEMEEDGKGDEKIESQKMDIDKDEVKETRKSEVEEDETEGKESKEEKTKEVEEPKSEAMEEEIGVKLNEGSEEKVAELVEEKENPEKVEEGKGSKKRRKSKIVEEFKPVKEKQEQEQKTPVASTIERPVRERKSVERLVASFEIEAVKEFHIAKVSLFYFPFYRFYV